jgi:hypothetical protein
MDRLIFFLVGTFMCSFLSTKAQFGYYEQALQFSQTSFGGTARIQGIGGAQVALGGDLSHASSNPAGLGFYNRGAFSVTPGLNFHKTESDYLKQSNLDKKVNFNIAQLGLSFYFGDGDIATQPIRGSSFAITVDRVNDFYNETYYQGENYDNSYINAVVENPFDDPTLTSTFYDQFLINPHPNNYEFYPGFGELVGYDTIPNYPGYSSPFESSRPTQSNSIVTEGSQYAINFAYGANYMDWLYFGASLSLNSLDYKKVENYNEFDYFYYEQDGTLTSEDALDNITIRNQLSIVGTGAGANFGIIVRPLSHLILGLSYATPSFMRLDEEFFTDISTNYFDNYDYVSVTFDTEDIDDDPQTRFVENTSELAVFEELGDIFVSTYTLTTPGKFNIGLSYFLGKNGFLTGEVEFKDYSNLFLNGKDFDLSADNQEIKERYKSVLNYRIGAEYKVGSFQLRGGYGFQEDPYTSSNYNRNTDQFSIGFGYREADFFIDFALTHQRMKRYVSPYYIEVNQPIARLSDYQTTALFTLGLNF